MNQIALVRLLLSMDIPRSVLAAFPPSRNLLLNRVRSQVDDRMLMDVARADYGMGAEEAFPVLRAIRDDGTVSTAPKGMLREVLELTRYCQPDSPNQPPFEPGPSGVRGHWTRLFACAVLLEMDANPTNTYSDAGEDYTLAICLQSSKVLGEPITEAVARFLTWRASRADYPFAELFGLLAILICALRLSDRQNPTLLADLSDCILATERLDPFRSADPSDPKPLPFGVQQGVWAPLLAELKLAAEAMPPGELRTNLELCGLLLTAD